MQVDRHTRRLRHGVGPLLLLVASVSACLGAIEVLLRWNVIPNEYYLRNQVLGDSRRDGPLLFISGDSFIAPTAANVVDHLYPALASYGVRIRNTATPGTGPLQYLESLRREGARYGPNVVLLSYYVGNDLADVGCGSDLDERLLATRSMPAWKTIYSVQYLRELLRRLFPGRVILAQALRRAPIGDAASGGWGHSSVRPSFAASLAGPNRSPSRSAALHPSGVARGLCFASRTSTTSA